MRLGASIAPGMASFTQPFFCRLPQPFESLSRNGRDNLPTLDTAECIPIAAIPGASRLFLDYCAGADSAQAFYAPSSPSDWQRRPELPGHWPALVAQLSAQNPGAEARASLDALRQGAGAVVTGQQVGLFGGPLFTPFKAATAIARARQATDAGHPHAAIFWLASEDHDFAEINHVTFLSRRKLRKLVYEGAPQAARPVGSIVLDESIEPLIEQAWELLGSSEAMDALAEAYKPGQTFAQAFADFYATVFAAQGLLILDAESREIHRMGALVLRAALERADELHARLLERNRELEAAGYHAQVAVAPQSSLLFLIDSETGARVALKRIAPTAAEPAGLWQAGRQKYSTSDLLGILESEPDRVSPAALLRPVFQDYLLATSLIVGGPAEIAYFAQTAVLSDAILGRKTPLHPRLSATLIEPAVAELLRQHEVTPEQVFSETQEGLTHLLAARAMPIEGKRKLASAGNALNGELEGLLDWMRALDAGLGRSAETAASKMRYQMNRLRRLAANFQLQKEASLARHAESISQALYPEGHLQERLHGAAYYFARQGFELAEQLAATAEKLCPGHAILWL
jgi:bacillithiol biosynthesis cysteine-adding enzyme BshC